MLFVEVVGDGDAHQVADEIRVRDSEDIISVVTAEFSNSGQPVGLRVAAPSVYAEASLAESVDIALDRSSGLAAQVDRLWEGRLQLFARAMAGQPVKSYPAVVQAYDPQWTTVACRRLTRVQQVLEPFDPGREFTYDHIGSTAVLSLDAKAVIDLQVRLPRVPDSGPLDATMYRIGYLPARGSRPDSPGVYRDNPRGDEDVPDEVWAKRLFYHPDPLLPSILHVRRADSPFGRHTVWFCDWLRAHPGQRERYREFKTQLAEEHAGDADYDDYTRAKTKFFDDVQHDFERWARRYT